MSDQNKLICGMTAPTARRYIVVRKEIDILIKQVNKAGHWLSEFEKAKPDGLCHTLAMIGVLIMHNMAQIHHYLENEFVSLEKIYDAINDHRK
jgi:hypothetical protein